MGVSRAMLSMMFFKTVVLPCPVGPEMMVMPPSLALSCKRACCSLAKPKLVRRSSMVPVLSEASERRRMASTTPGRPPWGSCTGSECRRTA